MKKVLFVKNIFMTVLLSVIAIASPANASSAGEVTGEITVSCYDSETYKNFLEYAAKSFEEKYPEAKVSINAFSTMPIVRTIINNDTETMLYIDSKKDPQAQKDYISRVNTEIMSGGGADIYAIDILPYFKYAYSGMFEDLHQFMDNDSSFVYNNYPENIFDAVIYKGRQYILPLDYGFNLLTCNITLIDPEVSGNLKFGEYTYEQLMQFGYDSFVNLYDTSADNQIKLFNRYTGYDYITLYNELLNVNYNIFVDLESKKANFTDGRFSLILNNAKEFGENGYIGTGPAYVDYLYKLLSDECLLEALSIDDITDMGGVAVPVYPSSTIMKDDELIGMLTGDNGENVFKTSQAYAMSINSKNKDTAWAFLRFLLGDEMQSSRALKYIPISKNIAAQKTRFHLYNLYLNRGVWLEGLTYRTRNQADESEETTSRSGGVLDMAGSSVFDLGNAELTDTQQEIYDIYMDYITRYTAMINAYSSRDTIIDEIIETEVVKFFDGSRTADEVASVLQNKVNMYLQE